MRARFTRNIGIFLVAFGMALSASFASSALNAGAATSGTPFSCSAPVYYHVVSGQLNSIDPVTKAYSPIGDASAGEYNAIGYNIKDNFIYGFSTATGTKGQLVRVDSTGHVTFLGLPTNIFGAPGNEKPANVISGDFDLDGNLWVKYGAYAWKIDVTTNVATQVALSYMPGGVELVYIHGYFYQLIGTTLSRFDAAGNVSSATVSGVPATGSYGAGWTDASGNLFFSRNSSGEIYQISNYTSTSPTGSLAFVGAVTGNNDGTSCPPSDSIPTTTSSSTTSSSTTTTLATTSTTAASTTSTTAAATTTTASVLPTFVTNSPDDNNPTTPEVLDNSLAQTGSSTSAPVALFGIIMIAVGAFLLRASRRLRHLR